MLVVGESGEGKDVCLIDFSNSSRECLTRAEILKKELDIHFLHSRLLFWRHTSPLLPAAAMAL
jgi:hypothetical protein